MGRKILLFAAMLTMSLWFGCAGSGENQNYKVLEEDQPMFDTEPGRRGASGFGVLQSASAQDEVQMEAPATQPAVPLDDATEETLPLTMDEPWNDEPSLRGLGREHWPRITVRPEAGEACHHPIYFEDVDLGPTFATATLTTGIDGGSGGAGGSAGLSRGSGSVSPSAAGSADVAGGSPSGADLGTADPAVAAARSDISGAAGPVDSLEEVRETGGAGSIQPNLNPTSVAASNSLEVQIDQAFAGASDEVFTRNQLLGSVVQPAKFVFDLALLPFRAAVNPPWTIECETVSADR